MSWRRRTAIGGLPSDPLLENFRVVCAWCRRELKSGGPGAQTSHGTCPACAARLRGVGPVLRHRRPQANPLSRICNIPPVLYSTFRAGLPG